MHSSLHHTTPAPPTNPPTHPQPTHTHTHTHIHSTSLVEVVKRIQQSRLECIHGTAGQEEREGSRHPSSATTPLHPTITTAPPTSTRIPSIPNRYPPHPYTTRDAAANQTPASPTDRPPSSLPMAAAAVPLTALYGMYVVVPCGAPHMLEQLQRAGFSSKRGPKEERNVSRSGWESHPRIAALHTHTTQQQPSNTTMEPEPEPDPRLKGRASPSPPSVVGQGPDRRALGSHTPTGGRRFP